MTITPLSPLDPRHAEFHLSIRVADLDASIAFYAALLGTSPKDRTARFATFLSPSLRLNLVLVVNDSGQPLDTYSLYHLGLGLRDREAIIASYHSALAQGFEVVKPPRTTWHGTPLHELWLRDPTGYQVELYARLTPDELKQMPQDKRAVFLLPGSGP